MKHTSKPARHTTYSFYDGEAISKLESILYSHRLVKPYLKKEDTGPNHDGYLELVDFNGYPKGSMMAQVKALNPQNIKRKISFRFKNDKFLAFCCLDHGIPVLFIGVDRKNRVAYWQNMSTEFIDNLNNSRTIYLQRENIISEDNKSYYDAWLSLCETHRLKIKNHQERKKERDSPKKSPPIIKVSKQSISQAKQKLQILFIDINLKCKYYYAFIDLLEPFYLDKKDEEKRQKLRELFEITLAEEQEFISDMAQEGLVKIVGDLCITNDQKKAVELQKEIIEKGAIEIETILKLFT